MSVFVVPTAPEARGGGDAVRCAMCSTARLPACPPVRLGLQDHTHRPTAKQALRHPWLSPAFHEAKQRPISSTVVQRIQRFAQNNALRRTILELIAQASRGACKSSWGIGSGSCLIAAKIARHVASPANLPLAAGAAENDAGAVPHSARARRVWRVRGCLAVLAAGSCCSVAALAVDNLLHYLHPSKRLALPACLLARLPAAI